jgi:cytidyltransferase-like protein
MENHKKIKKLEELAKIIHSCHSESKKVVHCHGVFDLLHIGHIRHLEQARRMGDVSGYVHQSICRQRPHRRPLLKAFGKSLLH